MGGATCLAFILHIFIHFSSIGLISHDSLALYFCGLWVLELLGLVDVQEQVPQQALGVSQLIRNLSLILQLPIVLFVFRILVETDNSDGDARRQRRVIGV